VCTVGTIAIVSHVNVMRGLVYSIQETYTRDLFSNPQCCNFILSIEFNDLLCQENGFVRLSPYKLHGSLAKSVTNILSSSVRVFKNRGLRPIFVT
jgi:hypothetical protein